MDLRTRLYPMTLAAMAVGSSSCVFTTGHPTGSGDVYLSWSLPGGRACHDHPQVTQVQVSIDQGTPFEIPCADGQTSSGAIVTGTLSGTHRIDLSARDDNGFFYYGGGSTLIVRAGSSVALDVPLDWSVGGLPARWTFWDGYDYLTCAQAGVTDVYVNLIDSTNHYIYGGAGEPVSCSNGGLQGTDFEFLYPGTYQLSFQARGTSNVLYKTAQSPYPAVAVSLGVFPPLDTSTPAFPMTLP